MSTLIVPAHVPSVTEDVEQLRKAFGGWGTNEDLIISILAHRNAAQRKSIRQTYAETYNEDLLKALDKELSHDFERLVLLWTLEPAERDAVLANEATKRWTSSNQVLVEIACARSPHELLLAKQAYHARFKKSLEEDVAHHTTGDFRKLLVPLVSTYRYNGDEVNMTLAKSEAKILHENISKKDYSNEDLIRILATRSKPQVNATLNQYKNEFGHDIIEVLFGLEYAYAIQDIKEAFTIELSRPHGSTSKLELYCADVIRSVMDPSENVKTSSGHLGLDGSLATDQGSSNTICTLHSIGGLSWSLPEGRRIEDCLLCWVGADNAAFANVVLTFNGCEIVRYDAAENRLVTDVSHQRRILKRRYYLVEKAKDANIIGILVGTLGVAGYLHMINQMKGLITRAGKNVYTLVMGKPNPAKLANFPEVRNFLERCKIWSKNSRT